jgi:hypothetical protein
MTAAELSSSFKDWTYIAEFGAYMVIAGILGEGAELLVKLNKRKGFRKAWEYRLNPKLLFSFVKFAKPHALWIEVASLGLVAIGLIIEVAASHVAYGISDLQNAELHQEAGAAIFNAGTATNMAAQAIERAAKFDFARAIAEQQTAIIQSNNLVLQKELQQRIIAKEDITNFIFLTQKIPKVPIPIGTGEIRDETFNFARQLRYMFERAKFGTPISQINLIERIDIHQGLAFYDTLPEMTDKWDDVTLVCNTSTNPFNYGFHYELTNGFTRPIIAENEVGDTNVIYSALAFCLHQIRINVNCEQAAWMASNQCEFIVRQKSQ